MKVYKFKCESCGSTKYEKVDEKVYKCSYCGCSEELQVDKTEENKNLTNYKKECLRKLDEYDRNISKVVIRLILCALFGTFGVHRFFEGKAITAFLYMFTFGLLGIGVFFDIIRYALQIVNFARMRKYHDDELKQLEGGASVHE